MRLTKLEHAALILEDDDKRLFIDPGSFTTPITQAGHTVAVVITHEHADHWTPEQLNRILEQSPDAVIYGPEGVAKAASDFDVHVVHPGDTVEADPFTLRFFGGRHAVIHSSIPVVDNVGVIVNDALVYPGDSFAAPELAEIDVLAVPSSAPWLKASEFIDYVLGLKPKHSFSTHEMVSSVIGRQMADARIRWATEQGGGRYLGLNPGDTYEM
ncbi:MBL fold metallo-hydrolase [Humibacter albus]|jgi:L-ascorbate metabolism protein UlaG (beta-lactamase superfamily)|uniref:MBL fold metallo-hydrolase n=1 Tax=Humibacter albus TaxID=427754 RepID=UPI0003B38FB7|nr:MBL fold metallo-hydrolase [Humibacter albus]